MSFLITAWVLAVWATAARAHVRFWNVPGECNVKGVPCSAVPGLTLSTEYKPCLSHPEAAYGAHQAPINDTDAEFYGFYDGQRLMDPAEPLCPGKQYGAWIPFRFAFMTKGREALLTTERGQLSPYPASCFDAEWWSSELFVLDQECRGSHLSWGQVTRSGVIAFNLTIPCPTVDAPKWYTGRNSTKVPYDGTTIDDPVVVAGPAVEEFKMRLTSSSGAGDHFRQMTWTLKVAAKCGGQKCTTPPPIKDPCTFPITFMEPEVMDPKACRKNSNYACPEGSEKSDQGYMCMMRVANWRLHFSADFLNPGPCRPLNPCTANSGIRDTTKLLYEPRPGIHLMMEGPQQGYMSLAFATTSQMNNSDAVIGWYNPNTDMNYIYALPLGHHTSPFLFNKYRDFEYFAYAGMHIDNITKTQSFCFSREEYVYLSNNRTLSNGTRGNVPNVESLNFNGLMLLWAVHDTADDIVAHTPDNMGFVILQDLYANASSEHVSYNTTRAISHAVSRMHNSLCVSALVVSCLIALFVLGQL